MGLLRYQLFLGLGVGFLAIWYGILSTGTSNPLFVYTPLWAVVMLGIYAVGTIAYGVMNCKDFPEAAAEIEEQVKEAKVEMKKRGILEK
jgi:flagellar motor component MotA